MKSQSTSQSTKNDTVPIHRPKSVSFDNVEVSELNKEGGQPLAYINYNDQQRNAKTKLLVQTCNIKLTAHGIPQLGGDYYKDDNDREFIKIPLDPNQQSCVELNLHLEKADEYFGSDAIRKALFGKKAEKYEYQPCIKQPQEKDDDDDDNDDSSKKKKTKKDKKEYPKVNFCKMKFNFVSDSNDKDKHFNKTKFIRRDGDKKSSVNLKTMTDIANELKYQSDVKFIFAYNKLWANKTPMPGAKTIMYGVGFKIIAVEYVPSQSRGFNPESVSFLSDEENEFFNCHRDYDNYTAATHFLHCLITHYVGNDNWVGSLPRLIDDNIIKFPFYYSTIIKRYAPTSVLMDKFWHALQKDKTTVYPTKELEQTWKPV
jgi:hypothetical protein